MRSAADIQEIGKKLQVCELGLIIIFSRSDQDAFHSLAHFVKADDSDTVLIW